MQNVYFKNISSRNSNSFILENRIGYFKKWKILEPAIWISSRWKNKWPKTLLFLGGHDMFRNRAEKIKQISWHNYWFVLLSLNNFEVISDWLAVLRWLFSPSSIFASKGKKALWTQNQASLAWWCYKLSHL